MAGLSGLNPYSASTISVLTGVFHMNLNWLVHTVFYFQPFPKTTFGERTVIAVAVYYSNICATQNDDTTVDKHDVISDEVLVWLSLRSEVQVVCIWSS